MLVCFYHSKLLCINNSTQIARISLENIIIWPFVNVFASHFYTSDRISLPGHWTLLHYRTRIKHWSSWIFGSKRYWNPWSSILFAQCISLKSRYKDIPEIELTLSPVQNGVSKQELIQFFNTQYPIWTFIASEGTYFE